MTSTPDSPADPPPDSTAPPDPWGTRLPKHLRLRKPAEFKRVYDAKTRAGDGTLLVFGAPNGLEYQGVPVTRAGLSVSKKNGNAVARSTIKRRLRAAFRLARPDLPAGWDYILIPRPGVVPAAGVYQQSLARLAAKLPGRAGGKKGGKAKGRTR